MRVNPIVHKRDFSESTCPFGRQLAPWAGQAVSARVTTAPKRVVLLEYMAIKAVVAAITHQFF